MNFSLRGIGLVSHLPVKEDWTHKVCLYAQRDEGLLEGVKDLWQRTGTVMWVRSTEDQSYLGVQLDEALGEMRMGDFYYISLEQGEKILERDPLIDP